MPTKNVPTADVEITLARQAEENRRLRIPFTPGDSENRVINLYPEVTYQTFDGFGGAITEAAGHVYSLMSDTQKRELTETVFSPGGMNWQFVRVPIDSCDFSLGQYEASSREDLSDFSLARVEKTILPMLDGAQAAAGRRLPVMLSPWSPPAWMKTNGERAHGGRLRRECYGAWAEYICRYALEFRRRGYTVTALTLQNEPKAVQTWDSCVFTAAEQRAFLTRAMRPAMEKYGLTDLQIYLWDHNKERVWEWMRDVMDEETAPLVAGAAFHWYSGDHFDALDLCRQAFPDKRLVLSESCIEFCKFNRDDSVTAAQALAHEVIGDMNHGMNACCDWNLLLDERGGPNYVDNFCLAPFHYDTASGRLIPHLISRYYAHFAGAARPGSVRVACTSFSADVEATAWRRTDGTIAAVLLNRGKRSRVILRLENREAALTLPPRSIATAVIETN